jgi:hypothetical protein
MGLGSLIPGMVSGVKQIVNSFQDGRASRKINPVYNPYEVSQYAKAKHGLAGLLLNGRMAGASQAENNIFQAQANTAAQAQRAAGDSSTLLAMLAGTQAQTNDSLNQLGVAESQDYQNRLQNYNAAQDAMTAEMDKVYQDKMNKYMIDLNMKTGLKNASRQGFVNGMATYGSAVDGAIEQAMSLINPAGSLSGLMGKGFGGGQASGAGAGSGF